jgi:hypothetical protein
MKRLVLWWGHAVLLLAILSGCSAQVSDVFKRVLDAVTLQNQSVLTVVRNSTSEQAMLCERGNEVVLRRSAALGRQLFCRENAALAEGLTPGEYCTGGVPITNISVPPVVKDCSEITLCGIPPSTVQSVSQRSDGGTVDELRFSNLPWGCEIDLEYSVDPDFKPENVVSLKIDILPSECPFCATQNKKTCLPCRDLAEDEEIKSGQVIDSCSGPTCRACPVIGQASQLVPHGEGKLYYKREVGLCNQKCGDNSAMRVCNNGLWEGDPAYSYPQCFDNPCGCNLSGDPVSYAHRDSKMIYKSVNPGCGQRCPDIGVLVSCNDGVWETGTPGVPFPGAELAKYPSRTCSEKPCHCMRTGRMTVADGQSRTVYSKDLVSCAQKCPDYAGSVQCTAGQLSAANPEFLNFGFDACMQEDCGCRVNLDAGNFVLLQNGGKTKVYRYAQNSLDVIDACTNPAHQIEITCTNKVLTPSYDDKVFKHQACQEIPLGCSFTTGTGTKVDVAHMARLDVTVTTTPRCDEACQNLQLTCDNRVFKKRVGANLVEVPAAELALYKQAGTCTPKNCSCNINGHIIAYNSSATNFYSKDLVTDCDINGCEKARTKITCTENGPVTENGAPVADYKFRSCEVKLCECATPWGGSIENGKTVKVFKSGQATCQDRLVCDNASNFKSLSCNNGQLTPYDTNQYPFQSCAPAVCECKIGNLQVPFNTDVTVYKYEQAPDGELCRDHSQVARCNPGGLVTGADISQYPYTTCADLNDDGTGGGTGGGTGNDEGPGSGIKRRLGVGDGDDGGGGPPRPCVSVGGCRSNALYTSPPVTQKAACVLPWGGGEVEYFGSVSAFDTMCVTRPDRCSKHRIMRTCHQLGWTGGESFKFPQCEEKVACP